MYIGTQFDGDQDWKLMRDEFLSIIRDKDAEISSLKLIIDLLESERQKRNNPQPGPAEPAVLSKSTCYLLGESCKGIE